MSPTVPYGNKEVEEARLEREGRYFQEVAQRVRLRGAGGRVQKCVARMELCTREMGVPQALDQGRGGVSWLAERGNVDPELEGIRELPRPDFALLAALDLVAWEVPQALKQIRKWLLQQAREWMRQADNYLALDNRCPGELRRWYASRILGDRVWQGRRLHRGSESSSSTSGQQVRSDSEENRRRAEAGRKASERTWQARLALWSTQEVVARLGEIGTIVQGDLRRRARQSLALEVTKQLNTMALATRRLDQLLDAAEHVTRDSYDGMWEDNLGGVWRRGILTDR